MRISKLSLAATISATALAFAAPVQADELRDDLMADMPELMELYRDLHANPELSFEEHETAAKLAKRMRALGFEVTEGVGQTGVVSVMRNGEGPVVLLRADMDGLPVVEQTGLPYASTQTATPASGVTTGVMHACGHDLHMSVGLGAALGLSELRDQWSGTVLFVWQPAEELGLGAVQMLDDPRFTKLIDRYGKPRVALAIHAAADRPVGHVGLRAGWISANVDEVDVTIFGRGGHGARPHETIDPIIIGAHTVTALQTIVSRRVPPGERAVVTVGRFASGTKHNIIPAKAELLLTVRSYGDEMRAHLLTEIKRTVHAVASAHGAKKPPKITIQDPYTPAGYNDPAWTEKLRAAFARRIGTDRVASYPPRTGGEDFGQFSRRLDVPSVMWRLGAQALKWFGRPGAEPRPGLYSGRFAPSAQPALRTGILLSLEAIRVALERP